MAPLHSDKVTDVATSSNFRQVRTTNIHLDLEVVFEDKTIKGTERISFDVLCDGVKEVKLDIHDTLKVSSVTDSASKQPLQFSAEPFTGYGSTLRIQLAKEASSGDKLEVEVEYSAGGGPGVEWLKPEQTAGGKKPFMYTQGQACLNRSFFPCQDTPAVKAPYSANVKVPGGFTAVMSASESSKGEDSNTFSFRLKQPIPSYLVALAVGDLASAQIGPRSSVYAEPSVLEAARAEFDGEVEKFLSTGERLFGEYQWGRYDLLIMPPSFPFGGMENPCLTFVTPCIVVGDKSLTDVVIHEISHSWFGNLVTNANWSEFWLNEGFTMFAQRRIHEKLFGERTMCLEASIRQQLLRLHMTNTGMGFTMFAQRRILEETFGRGSMCLEAATGQALLRQHMTSSGMDHPLNKLRVEIGPGINPDDTYNETPYEKGFAFVCYLRSLVGDVDKFDNFLKAYVAKFQFQSIVAEDLFDFYLNYFPELKQQSVDTKPGFEFGATWLHKSGWPPYTPDLSAGRQLMDPPEQLASTLHSLKPEEWPEIEKWTVYQVLHFIDKLVDRSDLTSDLVGTLGQKYPRISQSKNSEIRLRWYQLVIKNDYQAEFPQVKDFLHIQGKQKYTLPIYRALMKGSEAARSLAGEIFEETKHKIHVNVRNYVMEIMKAAQ